MKRIIFIGITVIFCQLDCFSREGNIKVYLGFSFFENKYEVFDNLPTYQKSKPKFELGVGYTFNYFELGVYGSYTRVSSPIDNDLGLISFGVNGKYHFSPLLLKNKISNIIDIYGIGKISGYSYDGKFRNYETTSPGINYGVGLGVTIFPIKVLGFYVDYGYIWNNPSKSILNQDFLQFGICAKL